MPHRNLRCLHRPRCPHRLRSLAAAVLPAAAMTLAMTLAMALAMTLAAAPAAAQVNFKPLERDDFTEVEERVIALRGLEAGLDYALRIENNEYDGLGPGEDGTEVFQDARLRLNTVFHRDVSFNLVLEPGRGRFQDTSIRTDPGEEADEDGELTDGQPTTIQAREVYLRYNFNPRSGFIMGKHELSLGDRRGKVFDAIVPALTFDCEVGTWCMPFGLADIGSRSGDAVYHWALQYNAWDTQGERFRDRLEVEIFRIFYIESNVPLGTNLGPTVFDPDEATLGNAHPTQATDGSGQPVFYDARKQDYYGFRFIWEGGSFFWNFDVTAVRGTRDYHTYRDPEGGIGPTLAGTSADKVNLPVSGEAVETEIGWRWSTGRLGLRVMNASGDEDHDPGAPRFRQGVDSYFEITPGTYDGARLWFNGTDSAVDGGAGLGHSIANTRLVGFFLDYADPEGQRLGYRLGLHRLTYNNPIVDADGELQDEIGLEVDNMLTWFVHKALKFQFEANLIDPGDAFRLSDFERPDPEADFFFQGIARLVYTF